jgi:hypothetical protein
MNMNNEHIDCWQMDSGLLTTLACILKISVKDLIRTGPELYPDMANDGRVIYYQLFFNENASREILNKINGIDYDKTVLINADMLDQNADGYKGLYQNSFPDLKC